MVIWLGEVEPWGLKNLIEAAKNPLEAQSCIHHGAVKVVLNPLRGPRWTRVSGASPCPGARDVTVCCGSQTLGWDQFCWVVDSCASTPSFPDTDIYVDEFRALRDKWKASATAFPPDAPKAAGSEDMVQDCETWATELLTLIYDFGSRRATDPRDKVFAFAQLYLVRRRVFILNIPQSWKYVPMVLSMHSQG